MNWVLFAGASAILHAIWMLLLKRDMKHESRTQLLALQPLVGAIIVGLFFDVDFGFFFTPRIWLLIMLALCVSLAVYCGTMALKRLPISIYAPMVNISPVFLLLFSFLLLGETIGGLQMVGLGITLVGAMLLDIGPDKHVHLIRFFKQRAVILLLLMGILVSFPPLLVRISLQYTNIYTILFYFPIFVSVIYWILHYIKYKQLAWHNIERVEWGWIALTGLVIFVSDFLYLSAVAIPGTILVLIVGVRRLSTLFATLFGGRLLHEDHLVYKGAMCGLMIIGTILLIS